MNVNKNYRLNPDIKKEVSVITGTSDLVGCEGVEPTTPALSRRCSKPTELTSQWGCKDINSFQKVKDNE